MTSRDDELEQLKRIDLRIVAAGLGFTFNTKKSSRGSACMDHPNGHRILIGLADDGHFVWCAVRGHGSGSCIDLWQQHRGGSLGDVRRALRPLLKGPGSTPPPLPTAAGGHQDQAFPPLHPIECDILGVQARYAGYRPLGPYHPYLSGERRIPGSVLADPRFAERLKLDERENAVFPHYDSSGVCGWEARNHVFVSFAKGGTKGIWCSVPDPGDTRLVLTESGIDALSYAAIRGSERSRFLSFSGGLNDRQPALLQNAMRLMPPGSAVVAAVDNDEAGDGFVAVLEELFDELGRDDLVFIEDRPAVAGADWNDVLVSDAPQPDGSARQEPR